MPRQPSSTKKYPKKSSRWKTRSNVNPDTGKQFKDNKVRVTSDMGGKSPKLEQWQDLAAKKAR